jgi:hypothetical protein
MDSNVQIITCRPFRKAALTLHKTAVPKSGIHATSEVSPAENSVELEVLGAEFDCEFQPATTEERILADIVVRNEWALRRLARLEANYWRLKDHEAKFIPDHHLDASFVLDKNFTRLQWRINCAQRNLLTAVDRFRALRASTRRASPRTVTIEAA